MASHFVKLTIYPLLMGLDSSTINMKGVDFSLHLRFRYFFSKEKKVNLHYFNKISLAFLIKICDILFKHKHGYF